jgi:hypothetical protein
MTPLKSFWGVIDPAEMISAIDFDEFDDLGVYEAICETDLARKTGL